MTRVPMEGKVLNEKDRAAAELRAEFARHGVFAVNLISSPGSGKTALLERTLESYSPGRRVAVLTGDIQTDADAACLARYRFPARTIRPEIQISRLSCTTKEGIDEWLRSIDARALSGTKAAPPAPQLVP